MDVAEINHAVRPPARRRDAPGLGDAGLIADGMCRVGCSSDVNSGGKDNRLGDAGRDSERASDGVAWCVMPGSPVSDPVTKVVYLRTGP